MLVHYTLVIEIKVEGENKRSHKIINMFVHCNSTSIDPYKLPIYHVSIEIIYIEVKPFFMVYLLLDIDLDMTDLFTF